MTADTTLSARSAYSAASASSQCAQRVLSGYSAASMYSAPSQRCFFGRVSVMCFFWLTQCPQRLTRDAETLSNAVWPVTQQRRTSAGMVLTGNLKYNHSEAADRSVRKKYQETSTQTSTERPRRLPRRLPRFFAGVRCVRSVGLVLADLLPFDSGWQSERGAVDASDRMLVTVR